MKIKLFNARVMRMRYNVSIQFSSKESSQGQDCNSDSLVFKVEQGTFQNQSLSTTMRKHLKGNKVSQLLRENYLWHRKKGYITADQKFTQNHIQKCCLYLWNQ